MSDERDYYGLTALDWCKSLNDQQGALAFKAKLPHLKVCDAESNVESLDAQACYQRFGFHLIDRNLFHKKWHMKAIILYLRLLFRLLWFKHICNENAFKYLYFNEAIGAEQCCVKHLGERVGYGVVALDNIENDTLIDEYVGKFSVLHFLSYGADSRYMMNYPMPTLHGTKLTIDALNYGNITRFINHSDQPNTRMKVAYDGSLFRLLVVSNRKILLGEELRLDYGPGYWLKRGAPSE